MKTEQHIEDKFAEAIFNGEVGWRAYMAIKPRISKKTAYEKASRLARKPGVLARIEQLTKAREHAEATAIATAAREVGEQFKGKLLTSARRRQLLQARAENPYISEAELAAVLKLDAELAGDFKTALELTGKDGEALPSAVPTIVINLPPEMVGARITKK